MDFAVNRKKLPTKSFPGHANWMTENFSPNDWMPISVNLSMMLAFVIAYNAQSTMTRIKSILFFMSVFGHKSIYHKYTRNESFCQSKPS